MTLHCSSLERALFLEKTVDRGIEHKRSPGSQAGRQDPARNNGQDGFGVHRLGALDDSDSDHRPDNGR